MNKQFLEAVFTDSIQHPNFFNGRILTATDLREEQGANQKRSRYVAQAIGSGVAYGLTVSIAKDNKSLNISGGLAISPRGDTLSLSTEKITIPLSETARAALPDSSPFTPCDLADLTTVSSSVDTQYYLLAITSANRLSPQLAAHSGLDNSRHRCTSRYEEVGIQFRPIPIIDQALSQTSKLLGRSQLAHLCLGTQEVVSDLADPLALPDYYGLEDRLRLEGKAGRAGGLSDCDVPLAVFNYQNDRIQFVDMWSVRRVCKPGVRPLAYPFNGKSNFQDEWFKPLISPRRVSEASAFFLQFQSQLEDLQSSVAASKRQQLSATDYFKYLPPAGFLPIGSGGFSPTKFFGKSLPTYTFSDPALMRSLIQNSFQQEPFVPGEPVALYSFEGSPSRSPYLLFVRQVPEPRPNTQPSVPDVDSNENGTLYVSIVDKDGNAVKAGVVKSIEAVNSKTGETYSENKPCSKFGNALEQRAILAAMERYRRSIKTFKNPYKGLRYVGETNAAKSDRVTRGATEKRIANKIEYDIPFSTPTYQPSTQQSTLYRLSLPPGEYVVKANLGNNIYLVSTSTITKIRANNNTSAVLRLTPRVMTLPDGTVRIPTKPLEGFKGNVGFEVDSFVFHQNYKNRFANWQEATLGSIPIDNIDPDLWQKIDSPALNIAAEDILSTQESNATIATTRPDIFIRKDYNPASPDDGFNAFIRTQDSSTIPFIVIPADNVSGSATSVAKVPIPDFDRSTVMKLDAAGLGDLDTFASAPKELVAAILGQSVDYSNSLIKDSQASIREDFQEGFLGFSGINANMNNALKSAGIKKVDLANKTVAEIEAILTDNNLPENNRGTFAERFLLDVQRSLPPETFSVTTLDLSDQQKARLTDEADIKTLEQFRNKLGTQEGKDEVKLLLGIDDEGLETTRRVAEVKKALGEFESSADQSISAIGGIDKATAKSLMDIGITSSKTLALLEASQLAEQLGLSSAEQASEIISTVKDKTDAVRSTLARELLNSSEPGATVVGGNDFTSIGEIARVELTETRVIKPAQAVLNRFVKRELSRLPINLESTLE